MRCVPCVPGGAAKSVRITPTRSELSLFVVFVFFGSLRLLVLLLVFVTLAFLLAFLFEEDEAVAEEEDEAAAEEEDEAAAEASPPAAAEADPLAAAAAAAAAVKEAEVAILCSRVFTGKL